MATLSTITSEKAWAPDIQAFLPSETIPDALIMRAATLVTQELEGDGPVARIPWVNDANADFVAEADEITESEPELAEILVATGKISQLIPISREQFHQTGTSRLLADSVHRAILKRANSAFIAQEAPGVGEISPPEGIVTQAGIVTDDPITTDLDPLAQVIGEIEENDGTPNIILANPAAWAQLRTLKTQTGAHTSLLGAGTNDADKRLLGIPVQTSGAVPTGTLLVVDRTAIAAGAGPIRIAQSEHLYFASDSVALRATWRIGWKVADPDRLGLVTVTMPEVD